MKLSKNHRIYFLGIGGIGMSALARWFSHKGHEVSGYDRTPTQLTDQLQQEGIKVTFEDKVESLPAFVRDNKEKVLVVYTPAIPSDHPQLQFFQKKGFEIQKRAQVLGRISREYFTIAVAGTHGKTTTSSMIAQILYDAGRNMAAFLGGITQKFNSNLVLQGEMNEQALVVAEADEYDRSFLNLYPDLAIITSADADHLDIYGDKHNLTRSFKDFIGQIKPGGKLIIKSSIADDLIDDGVENLELIKYDLQQAQAFATSIRVEENQFVFDYFDHDQEIRNIRLAIPGFHNIENAVAAIVACLSVGIEPDMISQSLAEFRGVKRRFEYIINTAGLVFIDDYAHHPVEITALLKSVRALHQGKRIMTIFQPHLFSRTRDFAEEFGQSLSLADDVILLDIYPAREEPIPEVTAKLIYDKVDTRQKMLVKKENLKGLLSRFDVQVLVTLGAGDIDKLVPEINTLLSQKEGGYEAV
ncbi:MAG: UDP-N-acetylmuramate--L-alanine ligase [Candidatus Cyclobacteriaceae bacterium M3_2C_046]